MGKRIRSRRRGRGGKYQTCSHRFKDEIKYPQIASTDAIVTDLTHDPGRTAPIAEIKFPNGKKKYMLPPEGTQVDQHIHIGEQAEIEPGNILPLGQIPEGTHVFNIEGEIGDGGKYVRAGGTTAIVVSQGHKTVIQLPSGQFKQFDPNCRATIGVVAGGGRHDKPLAKAGKKFHIMRSRPKIWPRVSGVSMAPVYHPHGGGSHDHIGGPSTKSRHSPPGQKVGRFSPKRKKKS